MIERANYLLARAFLAYLSGVMRTKAVSVDRYWFYLRHTILWLDDTPAGRAGSRTPSLRDYIDALQRQRNMSAQTAHKILQLSRRFFEWCKARRAHEFSALSRDWISSLRLERGVIQQTRAERHYFTLDECRQIAAHDIPAGDLAMRRDQAAACLLFLSGMRVGALVTLPIACVNLASLAIQQFPSAGVHTKNSKHATTYLFNIPELLDALTRWDAFVRTRLPETATWYAHVQRHWYEQSLVDSAPAPSRAGDFNKRLRLLLARAGVPRRSAHQFRHGHAVHGLQQARSLADYKAISQNLMHENIQITDGIYADLVGSEVQRRVTSLGAPATDSANLQRTTDVGIRDPEVAHALAILTERLAR